MNFRNNKRVSIVAFVVFVLFLLLVSFAVASTPEPPAVPRDYVIDLAGVMNDSTKSQLNALLHELEQKTTAQVLVLTVPLRESVWKSRSDGKGIPNLRQATRREASPPLLGGIINIVGVLCRNGRLLIALRVVL